MDTRLRMFFTPPCPPGVDRVRHARKAKSYYLSMPASKYIRKFRPAPFLADHNTIVKKGDILIDGNGRAIVATTANNDPISSEWEKWIYQNSFRACYIGGDENSDWLEHANQVRHATKKEIRIIKKFKPNWQISIYF